MTQTTSSADKAMPAEGATVYLDVIARTACPRWVIAEVIHGGPTLRPLFANQ